jgi:hypothetical protein
MTNEKGMKWRLKWPFLKRTRHRKMLSAEERTVDNEFADVWDAVGQQRPGLERYWERDAEGFRPRGFRDYDRIRRFFEPETYATAGLLTE